jgi:hypothetical protein
LLRAARNEDFIIIYSQPRMPPIDARLKIPPPSILGRFAITHPGHCYALHDGTQKEFKAWRRPVSPHFPRFSIPEAADLSSCFFAPAACLRNDVGGPGQAWAGADASEEMVD